MEDNNELINPLLHYRYDYCFKCSSPAIECYDYFNNPMGYSRLVTAKLNNKDWTSQIPKNKTIFSMECRLCGQKYDISYNCEKDHFPTPISKDFFLTKVFYSGYKDDGREFFKDKRLDLSKL